MAKHTPQEMQLVMFGTGFLSSPEREESGSITAGGDLRAVSILNRIPPGVLRPLIVSSQHGIEVFTKNVTSGLESMSIDNAFQRASQTLPFLMTLYLARCLAGVLKGLRIRLSTTQLIAYSISNTLPDVMTCAILRMIGKFQKWIAVVHHWPQPRIMKYGSRRERLISAATADFSFLMISMFADRVVAYNQPAIDRLAHFGYPLSRVVFNGNGVDLSEIRKNVIPGNRRRPLSAVYVGRLSRQKGVLQLLAIWERVLAKSPNAVLVLVGSEDTLTYDDIRLRASANGTASQLEIKGVVERDELVRIVAGSSVFVNASFVEGWSLSILESLACGTPVVAWDLPIYNEIYGSAIAKVRVGDLDGFAETVVRVLTDGETRETLVAEGEALATRHTWDAIAVKEWRTILDVANS